MINTNEHQQPFAVLDSYVVSKQRLGSRSPELSHQFTDLLLLPKTVASILCVTVQTLSSWRCSGKYDLNFVKIGSKVLYRQSDVLAFIDSCREGK